MSREVRRVTKNWKHPIEGVYGNGKPRHRPLFDSYAADLRKFEERAASHGVEEAIEYFGGRPDPADYMPDWPDSERTHLMMYETTTEGTPISPAFKTPRQLARWLADNGASAFGPQGATFEEWLAMIEAGSSVGSAMLSKETGLISGVAAVSKGPKKGGRHG